VAVDGDVRVEIAEPARVSPVWVASLLDELAARRGA
jgi:hypothetical protein